MIHLPPGSRSRGYIHDRFDARDYSAEVHLSTVSAERAKASLLDVRGPALYQDGVGACVAFALSRALYMSMRLEGDAEPPMPSQQFLYYNARQQAYAGRSIGNALALKDEGCEPRLAMKATQALGFTTLEQVPFDPGTRNAQPPTNAYSEAFDQSGLLYTRIDDANVSVVAAVADALTKHYPVIFGVYVDTAFEAWAGGNPIAKLNTEDPDGGGHMLCVLEVADDLSTVTFDNWWGADWGTSVGDAKGVGVMTADCFWRYATDIYAVKATPFYTKADKGLAMRIRYLFFPGLVAALLSCTPSRPTPVDPSAPAHAPGVECPEACKNGAALCAVDVFVTPAGKGCGEVCANTEANGIDFHTPCLVHATTCDAYKACEKLAAL